MLLGDDRPDVIARVRRGDADALGAIYDEHHEHVRAFARRLVGDDASAEDLVQETFVALPDALGGFRREASLRSFIMGVAANRALHHVRAAARRRALVVKLDHDDRAPPSTPEDHAGRRQLAHALVRALDALPFDQRLAVVLCEIEERTAAEAAAIAGAPEATMRTRLFHAKRKLRELLDKRGVR